jgi:hypothetical protein
MPFILAINNRNYEMEPVMKMLNAALIIALALTSGLAFAERGSSEDNRILSPETAAGGHDSEARYFSPSDLTERNP